MHPIVERHLGDSAAIIHNAAFEKAVVKIQCGNEAVIRTEEDQIKIVLLDEEEEDYDGASIFPNDDAAQRLIDGRRQRQRARLNQQTRYRIMKHLHATTT